jgi:GLPGLI family protein
MKYTITFFFLLSLNYLFCQYETGFVKYGIDFNEKSYNKQFRSQDKPLSRSESFRKKYYNVYRKLYAQDIVFIKLDFNKNTYYSRPIEIMIPESIAKYGNMISRNNSNYSNFRDDLFLFHVNNSLGNMVIESKKNYTWEITNDFRTIAGYKCRKAILRKEISPNLDYKVWFTPQIPVAFTPVRYHGLPGATLAIQTPLKYIYAKEVEFKDNVTIKKPEDGKKISFEEYIDYITRFKPD